MRDAKSGSKVTPPSEKLHGRLLSESIALAKAHAEELGYEPTMDADFAKDVDAAIETHREHLNPPAWE